MSNIEIKKIGITHLNTDAIVNAANESLWAGGGVCGAIFSAAGHDQLQEACGAIGHCDTGSAVITPAFNLKAKYIIHAVGPRWRDGTHHAPQLLYSAYQKSLELAVVHGCHSIGFPLLSAGIFGYPSDKAWRKAIQACQDYLRQHPDVKMDITFAVIEDDELLLGQKTLRELSEDELSVTSSSERIFDTLLVDGVEHKAVFFHKPEEIDGFLSNWYPAKFELDGLCFTSTEQYIMYRKCAMLGDDAAAQLVLETDDVSKQQAIGRNAKPYNGVLWEGIRQVVAMHCLLAKFRQNPVLKGKLLETKDAYLVECAYSDKTWACGRGLDEEQRKDVSQWKGRNILGFALMEVRRILLEEQHKFEIANCLFAEKPIQMGLRGDHYFWYYLESAFISTPLLIDHDSIEEIVKDEFRNVSGCKLTMEARPYVEQFAHGGMSSGHLSGQYWLETGIPLLQKRLAEME